jgi:hypothetical protein
LTISKNFTILFFIPLNVSGIRSIVPQSRQKDQLPCTVWTRFARLSRRLGKGVLNGWLFSEGTTAMCFTGDPRRTQQSKSPFLLFRRQDETVHPFKA